VNTYPSIEDDSAILNVSNSELTRSEVRQFLVALSALAFLLSTLGLRDGGAMAFAADIVLVLCGGWCANQLIRGLDILKEQVICVLQAYFTGLLCCSVVLFAIGWMVFLPSEFLNLGNSLLFAATFTTNFQLALLPPVDALRFDGLLDHLWVPALIAQCCAILAALYWLLYRNVLLMLAVLGMIFVTSLSVSTADSPLVQMLPVGGLWAFLGGAIPFIAANRFPILRFALLLGIVNLVTGILLAVVIGDTLFARAFLALSFAFLYLGSRPQASATREMTEKLTKKRRNWFGMSLHIFLWALPLTHVVTALNMSNSSASNYSGLLLPSLLLAIVSWSIWRSVENRFELGKITPTAVIALMLLANGIATLTSQGLQLRYTDSAKAYIHAINSSQSTQSCPIMQEGPLAGLEVCILGPQGAPEVLIWGDHQLASLKPGYEEAAQQAGVSALFVALADCVPLDGLQTRFTHASELSGRSCDQHSAQILQAIPHLSSIKQVTIAADWLQYAGIPSSALKQRAPIRLGPIDGTPIDVSQQSMYVAKAVETTVQTLVDQGLRVSVIRQVPVHPRFDAELAARAHAPGNWLYQSMPELSTEVPLAEATARHAEVDQMFRRLSATGELHYVNTWPAFCSKTSCSARGGLSSDYINSTRLTRSGALALIPMLKSDLERVRTHTAHRPGFGS
jgi:hypothetical protein